MDSRFHPAIAAIKSGDLEGLQPPAGPSTAGIRRSRTTSNDRNRSLPPKVDKPLPQRPKLNRFSPIDDKVFLGRGSPDRHLEGTSGLSAGRYRHYHDSRP